MRPWIKDKIDVVLLTVIVISTLLFIVGTLVKYNRHNECLEKSCKVGIPTWIDDQCRCIEIPE